jgi:uncharacterized cupredoxin-like copper-binding protein
MWRLHHLIAVKGPQPKVVSDFDITVTDTGISLSGNQTIVAGARLILNVTNPTSQAASLTWDGAPFQSATMAGLGGNSVAAHEQRFFADDEPAPSMHRLGVSVGGHTSQIVFNVIEAISVPITLGHYAIEPGHKDFVVGKSYLIQVTNVHDTVHNLYIGHHGGAVLAHSESVTPGNVGSFLFAPTEKGDFEMWCNIPGHYELGMHGTVTVA